MKPLVLTDTEIVQAKIASGPQAGGILLEMRPRARTQQGQAALVPPLLMVVRDAESLVEILQRAIAEARGRPDTSHKNAPKH